MSTGKSKKRLPLLLDCLTLNMKVLRSFETSVTIYRSTRRNSFLHQHNCENLRSLQNRGSNSTNLLAQRNVLRGSETMPRERGGSIEEKVLDRQDLRPRPRVPIGWIMSVKLSLVVNKLPQAASPRYLGRGALLPVSNTFMV